MVGEIIPFRASGEKLPFTTDEVRLATANVVGVVARWAAVRNKLVQAREAAQQTLKRLDVLADSAGRTADFCRRCCEASEVDDLETMIERRDLLARELAQDEARKKTPADVPQPR